ncbi:MAG: hypothetical protein R3C58_07585 [Parvularculaceae bacterium]
MKSFLAAASVCAAAFAVSGASAQNAMSPGGLSNPNNVVRNFSVQTVGPVLNELGVVWQVETLQSGQQYVDAVYGGALRFVIFFTACQSDGSGCAGMNSVAFFETAANTQTVQAFNFRYQFASAGIDPDGVAYLSRYDLADYGIPRGNIASSISNFANLAAAFSEELATAHQTVSLDGYASDMSASHLNRQSFVGMTGNEIAPAAPSERHEASFETTAEIVQRLIKDKDVPRNKIDNTRD